LIITPTIFTSGSNEEKPCTIAAAEVEVDFPSIIKTTGRLSCLATDAEEAQSLSVPNPS